jgi:phosphate acetyltransferase
LRTLTLEDIQAFAAVSGDTNPAHLDPEYANDTMFHGVIAHGMWGGALISALLGTKFPGPGTSLSATDYIQNPFGLATP